MKGQTLKQLLSEAAEIAGNMSPVHVYINMNEPTEAVLNSTSLPLVQIHGYRQGHEIQVILSNSGNEFRILSE